MASTQFFATSADVHELLEWLFRETDVRVFEAYSRINHDLREFRSMEELRREDPAAASHGTLHLVLC